MVKSKTLFVCLICKVKDSDDVIHHGRVKDSMKLIHNGRIKDYINLITVESRTSLIYLIGRVKDSIDVFDLVESRILIEKILDKRLWEFLFGNSQIGFASQGLILQVLYMELGTPYKTWSYLFYQMKIRFRERGRERFRKENLFLKFFQTSVCSSSSFCSVHVSFFFFFSFFNGNDIEPSIWQRINLTSFAHECEVIQYIYIYIYQLLTLLILERAFILGPINLSKIYILW